MNETPDIREPAQVDAAWLTGVLQAGGVDAVVKSFTAANVGTGQIGDSVRFALSRFERGGEAAPARWSVSSHPRASRAGRPAQRSATTCARCGFYQQLAAGALIATPRCYFADIDEPTGAFVLMMEDLTPAEQGNQLAGVSLDRARLAVIEAAKLRLALGRRGPGRAALGLQRQGRAGEPRPTTRWSRRFGRASRPATARGSNPTGSRPASG